MLNQKQGRNSNSWGSPCRNNWAPPGQQNDFSNFPPGNLHQEYNSWQLPSLQQPAEVIAKVQSGSDSHGSAQICPGQVLTAPWWIFLCLSSTAVPCDLSDPHSRAPAALQKSCQRVWTNPCDNFKGFCGLDWGNLSLQVIFLPSLKALCEFHGLTWLFKSCLAGEKVPVSSWMAVLCLPFHRSPLVQASPKSTFYPLPLLICWCFFFHQSFFQAWF